MPNHKHKNRVDTYDVTYIHNMKGREFMPCPTCGATSTRVGNSRSAYLATATHIHGIGRVRECLKCESRWATLELSFDSLKYLTDLIDKEDD